jgi:hypothetical protein
VTADPGVLQYLYDGCVFKVADGDHIRALDAEATLPARARPTTVERYVIQGEKPR